MIEVGRMCSYGLGKLLTASVVWLKSRIESNWFALHGTPLKMSDLPIDTICSNINWQIIISVSSGRSYRLLGSHLFLKLDNHGLFLCHNRNWESARIGFAHQTHCCWKWVPDQHYFVYCRLWSNKAFLFPRLVLSLHFRLVALLLLQPIPLEDVMTLLAHLLTMLSCLIQSCQGDLWLQWLQWHIIFGDNSN